MKYQLNSEIDLEIKEKYKINNFKSIPKSKQIWKQICKPIQNWKWNRN